MVIHPSEWRRRWRTCGRAGHATTGGRSGLASPATSCAPRPSRRRAVRSPASPTCVRAPRDTRTIKTGSPTPSSSSRSVSRTTRSRTAGSAPGSWARPSRSPSGSANSSGWAWTCCCCSSAHSMRRWSASPRRSSRSWARSRRGCEGQCRETPELHRASRARSLQTWSKRVTLLLRPADVPLPLRTFGRRRTRRRWSARPAPRWEPRNTPPGDPAPPVPPRRARWRRHHPPHRDDPRPGLGLSGQAHASDPRGLRRPARGRHEPRRGDRDHHGARGVAPFQRGEGCRVHERWYQRARCRDHGWRVAARRCGRGRDKRWGRIGDSPILGAGTYASASCAVSGTGVGEYFMRNVVAYDICARVLYKGETLAAAADSVILGKLVAQGGEGGVIALDRNGHFVMTFNSEGMYRGHVGPDGEIVVRIYRDE